MSKLWMILTIVPTVACAGDPGTRPHDMSAAQHQSAAEQEEAAGTAHGAQYDPGATKDSTICGQTGTIRPSTQTGPPCWTSRTNPTAQHAQDAQRHRELAEKHRIASAALVEAEKKACAGIDEADRDTSPFYHREDIVSVEAAEREAPAYGKAPPSERLVGATVIFRPVPGLTAEWLQHEVNCHVARASAAGHEMPEMNYCPLVLKDVRATASSTGEAFAVQVTSDNMQTAQEILRRARALVGPAQ